MKKNLCFFVVSILLSMNSNAQDITTDSVAILDFIRNAGTRVQIRYVPIPKEKPKPNEFFSVQLGVYIAEIPSTQFENVENVYHIINEEDVYVYLSGEYDELNDAVKEKYELAKKGDRRSIYVVKVIDNRKVVLVE